MGTRHAYKDCRSSRRLDQASRKPTCPAADMVATGKLEEIAQAPFDS
jgi:hypothetical protein